MNALLTNRDGFTPPADGYYHIAPLGEFAHAQAGVTQVLDAAACESIVNRFKQDATVANFAGILVDFDHCSLDSDKRTEAAGWITDLQNRDTGLFAKIRWTDLGDTAVKGGRYRFLSPVWARSDCEDLGNNRLRPLRLLNAAVTNDPNLKGMRPMSNSTPPATPTLLKWTLGHSPQDRHCPSCQALANQVHTKDAWDAAGLHPQSAKLYCKGHCHCSLTPTTEPESGSLDTVRTITNRGWTDEARAASLDVRRSKAAQRRANKGNPTTPQDGDRLRDVAAEDPRTDEQRDAIAWAEKARLAFQAKFGRAPQDAADLEAAKQLVGPPPDGKLSPAVMPKDDGLVTTMPVPKEDGIVKTFPVPKDDARLVKALKKAAYTGDGDPAFQKLERRPPPDSPDEEGDGTGMGDADPVFRAQERRANREALFRDVTGIDPADAHQRAKALRKRENQGGSLNAEDQGFLDLYDAAFTEDTIGNRTVVDFLREIEGDNMTVDQLTNALAHERLKNAILVNQVVDAEDALVNRDLQDFDAVLSNDTRDFWREQLLTNRATALPALQELARTRSAPVAAPAPAAPAADPARQPLHNRAAARPVIPAVATVGTSPDATDRAAKIRNRAHELVRAERIPFQSAFRRAENELAAK